MVASLPTITVVQPSADAGKRTRTQKTIPFMTVIGLEASNKFYNELIFMKKKKTNHKGQTPLFETCCHLSLSETALIRQEWKKSTTTQSRLSYPSLLVATIHVLASMCKETHQVYIYIFF